MIDDALRAALASALAPDYLLTSLAVCVMPGTGVIYTLAHGLGRGSRASLIAAFGCTLGIVPHLVACAVGLAALLHSSAAAFQAVKLLGVAYLFYMAWGILRDGGALEVTSEGDGRPAHRIVLSGILLNLLNPKLTLFFLAFLPLFLPADAPAPALSILVLGAVFMAMTFAVFAVYGLCASAARTYVLAKPSVMKILRYGFAGAFGLLGLRLLLSER